MTIKNLGISCAFSALIAGFAQPALAQATSTNTAPAGVSDNTGTDASAKTAGLADIIVTATKVRTDSQKTPVSIQLIRGDAITSMGVTDTKELNRLVSSLSAQPSGGAGTSFYIRGVGNDNGNSNGDNGIAVNLDQVYFSRQYGPDLSFYDLDRVEVLKGPQGTLYGRNATGGVINIISAKPELHKLSGSARIEVGNYNAVRVNAAINIPVTDTLAVRGAFQVIKRDGYLTDGYNDDSQRGARIHVLWKPTSTFSLLLSGEYDHQGGKGQEAVPLGPDNTHFAFNNAYTGGNTPEGIAFINAIDASQFAAAQAAYNMNPMGPPPGHSNVGSRNPNNFIVLPPPGPPGLQDLQGHRLQRAAISFSREVVIPAVYQQVFRRPTQALLANLSMLRTTVMLILPLRVFALTSRPIWVLER